MLTRTGPFHDRKRAREWRQRNDAVSYTLFLDPLDGSPAALLLELTDRLPPGRPFTDFARAAGRVSVRPWMPNKSDAATAGYPPAEEIAFVYESITVTFEDGGVTFTDDWAAPGS